MNNKITNKNNIIFFLLLFLIPILALDASYYFLNNINAEWDKIDQEKKAVQEAEILASEADFGNQFSMLFKKYCDVIKGDVQLSFAKDIFLTSHLEQTANVIFSDPFPKYNLHVFRIASGSQSAEMLITRGDEKGGRRGLCLAFEHFYNIATNATVDPAKTKSNESFAKSLVGQFSDIDSIARDMRGLPTFVKHNNASNWFIWDYLVVPEKGVYGAILTCDEVNNFENIGRLLALRGQRARGRAIGAFVPIYKELGDPIYQSPLENSEIFCNWAKTLTVSDVADYDRWMKEDLPQGVALGNYTAFCHLERGSSYIAVVLVKAVNEMMWPKWLRSLNLLLFLSMVSIIFFGLCYESWPPINLRTRFVFSYILASILPLCLLTVTAYGYVKQYRNTSINKAISDLEAAMKSFDAQKIASINDYKNTFTKALNDPRLLTLIKEKGIESELVAQRVVDIFEKDEIAKPLPVFGVKICDESGIGALVKGSSASSMQSVEILMNSSLSANVYALRNRILSDDPEADKWMKPFEVSEENTIGEKAYLSITGNVVNNSMNKSASVPIPRKNGDFCSVQIFDFIKIDGKVRYMLLVMWDDRALDDRILQNAFDSYALKNLTHSFMGYRIKGQNVDFIGKKTRHATQKTIDKATELAKLVGNSKRVSTYIDDDCLVVAMPSANFSQTVLVGWIDMSNVVDGILERRLYLILLIVASLAVLGICSLRSVGVFLFPATKLTKALDAVSNGNLNIALKSDSDDELGRLSEEFSGMIEGLRERERLSRLISDQAVQALEKHSDTLLNNTETFDGVALVSDIRNFTGISEENDPMVITDLLNEHFAEMTKVISENGGLIYKFIGDAIEAVFPEKNDLKESASERAFRAGCMMIATLATINSKRKKRGTFTYRMGIGLCKGIMYSGSVGSFETRLDYAILGDALKTAAKLESFSIQNPSFPLVVSKNVADKIAIQGFTFREIDSKSEDFKAFVLENIENQEKAPATEASAITTVESDVKSLDTSKDELQVFALQKSTADKSKKKNLWFNIGIYLLIMLTVIAGFNIVYFTKFEACKRESNLECSRLVEQLNNDDILKTAFETLCLEFYEEVRKVIYSKKDGMMMSDLMKPVEECFKKLNRPIPMYYLCKFKHIRKHTLDADDFAYSGFTDEFAKKIASIPVILTFRASDNRDDVFIKPVLGANTNSFNTRSSLLRRASVSTINGEDMLVGTNRYYYDNNNVHRRLEAFVLCAMPLDIANTSKCLNYYKLLAGKYYLLAFNKGDEWVFSDDFPDKEISFLKSNSSNIEALNNTGYSLGEIKLGNEVWKIFAVSRKASSYHRSLVFYDISIVLATILILWLINMVLSKWFKRNSLTFKLRMDIIMAAILPLLTVSFVSYLYLNEDYAVKKAEKQAELQKDMDTLESRDYYFQPLCWDYIAKKSCSDEMAKLVKKANEADSEEEKNRAIKAVNKYLCENFRDNLRQNFNGLNPYINFNEILLISKEGWATSAVANDQTKIGKDGLTDFGRIFYDVLKATYLGSSTSSNTKDAVKGEMIVEKMKSVLDINFGKEASARFLNFPNQPIIMAVSYSTVGFYFATYPNMSNAEYVVLTMILFGNDRLSRYCDERNGMVDIENHIDSGSNGNEKYIHTCQYINMGRYLYHSTFEDYRALKELLSACYWVYSGKLPVSRTIDLNGEHILEARPGNKIGDTLFLSLTSCKPLQKKMQVFGSKIILVILLSVLLIFLIAQCIISDLLSPIKELIIGAKAAANGDYSFRTNLKRADELGVLCNSFDKMMKGLEEKQLMNRMVSKTALNVSSSKAGISSQRVNSFLLYVTVPGFTKILKNTDSIELFLKLRTQIASIAEIVLNAGGDIDKIMGEKLLIAFQVHDKKPEDVARIVCDVANAVENNTRLYYPIAIGINYGQVISGFLGVGEKRDFTVIGDPVNVAARIASLAEEQSSDRIMISETVLNFIADTMKAKEFGKVSLKGKSEQLRVYQLA